MLGHRRLETQDYVAILRRRWWLLIGLTALGLTVGYSVCRVIPNQYTSQTLVLVEPPTVPDSYVRPVITEDLNQRLASMQEQILSRTRLQQIVQQFGLYKKEANQAPTENLVGRLRRSIVVTPVTPMPQTRAQDLPGFYVSVTMDDARLAQQVCSEITSMFLEQNLRLRQQLSQNTTDFLTKQLEEAKARLDDQDAKLAEFQRRHIGELPDNQQTNLSLLSGLTTQLEAVTQVVSRVEQEKAFAKTLLTQELAAWKASQQGQNPQTLQQQLTDLQNQLGTLRARYTDSHPDVVKIKSEIARVQKQIDDAVAQGQGPAVDKDAKSPHVEPAHIQQLRAQLEQDDVIIRTHTKEQEQFQQQIKVLQSRVQMTPTVEQEFKMLTRDHQTALELYNDLLKKQNQSAMATDLERRQQGEQFRILDPPSLPEKPSYPDRLLFSLGGLGGGLGLGLGLTLLLEWRDQTLRTERDIEVCLQLPTLAVIPSLKPSRGKVKGGAGNLVAQQAAVTQLNSRSFNS
jgi:polysaccharide chain length determinant protein (PEP-CTERM system associated)